MVKFPVDALAAAENSTGVLAAALTVKGLAGFDVTPAGKPLSVTCTVPANPLLGVTDRFTAGLVTPCWTPTEFWEKEMEKSGCGGGGGSVGGGADTLEDPPPQPPIKSSSKPSDISGERGLLRAIERPHVVQTTNKTKSCIVNCQVKNYSG